MAITTTMHDERELVAPVMLCAPDGDLNRFVNAFLNDTDVRHLQALETPVAEGDTLVLLPAMAGG